MALKIFWSIFSKDMILIIHFFPSFKVNFISQEPIGRSDFFFMKNIHILDGSIFYLPCFFRKFFEGSDSSFQTFLKQEIQKYENWKSVVSLVKFDEMRFQCPLCTFPILVLIQKSFYWNPLTSGNPYSSCLYMTPHPSLYMLTMDKVDHSMS